MKKIIIFIIICIIISSLTATVYAWIPFHRYIDKYGYYIYNNQYDEEVGLFIDPVTKVNYFVYTDHYHNTVGNGMVLRVNTDGTPYIGYDWEK